MDNIMSSKLFTTRQGTVLLGVIAAVIAAIALVVAGMCWLVGVGPFLKVYLPIMLMAASMGVWLFYVQHQFEDVMWARGQGCTWTWPR